MRWIGSVVADVYRILIRGGVYLYPEDSREGYEHGRLRLLYEANPIAFLIEQAGGAAIDGFERILDVTPAVSPCANAADLRLEGQGRADRAILQRQPATRASAPLFAKRGLLRR